MVGALPSFSEKEMPGKKVILTFQKQRLTHDLNGVRYCLVTLSHSIEDIKRGLLNLAVLLIFSVVILFTKPDYTVSC